MSKRMNVLIACEESQAVCKEMRRLGHRAFSCDIIECSGGHPEWHIKGDVLPILDGRCKFRTMDGMEHEVADRWDMIIAHPPCTYMSKAGARWMYPKAGVVDTGRLRLAMEAKKFFLSMLYADCEKIAVENPRPLKIVALPACTQIVQPYEHGHEYSKATCLWLKGLPKITPTKIVSKYTPYMPSNTGAYKRGKGGARGVAHDPRTASKTFHGIARAFAEQWAGRVEEDEK